MPPTTTTSVEDDHVKDSVAEKLRQPTTKEEALDIVRYEAELRKGEEYQSTTRSYIQKHMVPPCNLDSIL